jgi:drug/metabolite transporter (DMT)-like permease
MSVSAFVRLLLLAAIWGCSFLFIKVALEGLAPTQIVLGRITLGAATLAAIVAVRHGRMPRDLATWAHLAFVSVLNNLLPFFLFAWGEQRVASSLAGIYNATTPLFTLLVAMAALPAERPTRARFAGIALGFLGVVVVLAPWRGVAGSSLTGQLACLTAGGCYGFGIVYTRRFLSGRGHAPLVLAAGQLICSSAILLLAVPLWAGHAPRLAPSVVASILALSILGTGIAYLIFYRLIGEIGATSASTVTYVIPLIAVALGVVALGEHIGWNDFAGAAVVVAGIAVAEGRLVRRRL